MGSAALEAAVSHPGKGEPNFQQRVMMTKLIKGEGGGGGGGKIK